MQKYFMKLVTGTVAFDDIKLLMEGGSVGGAIHILAVQLRFC